jgi:amidophosphoribosyltransferase
MSDAIKHECGIALLRLKKPLQFYTEKYGTAFYGLNKMYLLMQKQHHRGQDGAGLANIKIDIDPGKKYISRIRSNDAQPIRDVFSKVMARFSDLEKSNPELIKDSAYLKENFAFTGEVFLGHLRYGTFGGNSIENCHPFLRQNNWMTRNLVLAGNFNLTNVDELFSLLVELGQHPKEKADTVTAMEKIGHFLDEENQILFERFKSQGYSNVQISDLIAKHLDVQRVLSRASREWDGGYAMAGMFGHGDAFVVRDPNGIRPAFFYEDDEIVVVASEKTPIQSAFYVDADDISEIPAGYGLIIKKDGQTSLKEVREPKELTPCSFERIYFSKGNDKDIYKERQQLGRNVVPAILEAVEHDMDNTVFTFIPNTAETAFYGMIKELEDEDNRKKIEKLIQAGSGINKEEIEKIILTRTRIEKIVLKDVKLRTFITQDSARDEMVSSVYDVTHGAVVPNQDHLVVIDDSIVRGTTLKKSILRILDRLYPKTIIIVSSAPQIRFPDCYGIDMAKMGDFIAFQACVALHKERGSTNIMDVVYRKCLDQKEMPKEHVKNYVKEVYEPFTVEEINDKIAQLLTPSDLKAKVKIIYQSIEGLHQACPNHQGDWYFTGNYPTPGGNKVVNQAFINYMEGRNQRAY